jgi:hypothetical protein
MPIGVSPFFCKKGVGIWQKFNFQMEATRPYWRK